MQQSGSAPAAGAISSSCTARHQRQADDVTLQFAAEGAVLEGGEENV
jgi:hypothetical protein